MTMKTEPAATRTVLKKGERIIGSTRNEVAADMLARYRAGASIRSLAESCGRSYGFVHRLLAEQGATFRSRGGATRVRRP